MNPRANYLLEQMFTDPQYAREMLLGNESLHKDYRYILNNNLPRTEVGAIAAGFRKLPWYKSWFHNPWYNKFQNHKYVSQDGHYGGCLS